MKKLSLTTKYEGENFPANLMPFYEHYIFLKICSTLGFGFLEVLKIEISLFPDKFELNSVLPVQGISIYRHSQLSLIYKSKKY